MPTISHRSMVHSDQATYQWCTQILTETRNADYGPCKKQAKKQNWSGSNQADTTTFKVRTTQHQDNNMTPPFQPQRPNTSWTIQRVQDWAVCRICPDRHEQPQRQNAKHPHQAICSSCSAGTRTGPKGAICTCTWSIPIPGVDLLHQTSPALPQHTTQKASRYVHITTHLTQRTAKDRCIQSLPA